VIISTSWGTPVEIGSSRAGRSACRRAAQSAAARPREAMPDNPVLAGLNTEPGERSGRLSVTAHRLARHPVTSRGRIP